MPNTPSITSPVGRTAKVVKNRSKPIRNVLSARRIGGIAAAAAAFLPGKALPSRWRFSSTTLLAACEWVKRRGLTRQTARREIGGHTASEKSDGTGSDLPGGLRRHGRPPYPRIRGA